MRTPDNETNRFLHRFAWFTAGATVLLICSGGMVTSKGVGLAVPDWPTTFGYNMFFFPVSKWVGGVFFEHTHRLIASVIGFLTIILAIWLWLSKAERWVKTLGWVSLGAVVLQGILGGLRVTLLKDQIGIFHACLAQAFLGLLVIIALALSPVWRRFASFGGNVPSRALAIFGIVISGFIYGQLALGATMRHQHRDLAILDFPLAYGQIIPQTDPATIARINQARDAQALSDVSAGQIWLQMAHRFVAAIIGLTIAIFWYLVRRERARSAAPAQVVESLARARPPANHPGCLDNLEQQGRRYRDRACRGGRDHVCHRDRHFRRASSSAPGCMELAVPASDRRSTRGGRGVVKTAVIEPPAVPIERGWTMADLAELVKARLTFLVLITTAVGFYVGWRGPMDFVALLHAVAGTALAAGGAAALNQWWEHQYDAIMVRTRMRPIPAGRMSPREGLIVGTILGVGGVVYLAIAVNLISALLAAATIGIYLFAYTPLKRISITNTLVGAIPGALPPLIGWAAARNDLALPAWTLFAILFFWQLPHFFAIGWMYREDYARAGFVMLSGRDLEGGRTGRQSIFFTVLLLVASVTPIWFEIASLSYLPIALSLGTLFLALAFRFQMHRTLPTARHLFLGSIIYLPLLLGALVLTKR